MSTRCGLESVALLVFALAGFGCNVGGEDSEGGGDAAEGGDIPCYDGLYCPDGCTCDSSMGEGVCMMTGTDDVCEFGDFGGDEPPAFTDLDGEWWETYVCINNEGCEQSDFYPFTVVQDGANLQVDFGEGDSFEARLVGKNLEWTTSNPDWDEVGIWTFTDPVTCTKSSRWKSNTDGNGGDCWGIAVKEPGMPSPLPLPPECF